MEVAKDVEEKVALYHKQAQASLLEALGIRFLLLSKEKIVAEMPVAQETKQPFGLLHGGASLALAETAASVGAWLNIDDPSKKVVGAEINANHLRSVFAGSVTATASPVHLGRMTQVWDIRICNDDEELVCISRCTLSVFTAAGTDEKLP